MEGVRAAPINCMMASELVFCVGKQKVLVHLLNNPTPLHNLALHTRNAGHFAPALTLRKRSDILWRFPSLHAEISRTYMHYCLRLLA